MNDFRDDMAIINIPLSKRGDIDRELDRYKAQQKKAELIKKKQERSDFMARKRDAKSILLRHEKELIEKMGPAWSDKEKRSLLRDLATWEPGKFLMLARKLGFAI